MLACHDQPLYDHDQRQANNPVACFDGQVFEKASALRPAGFVVVSVVPAADGVLHVFHWCCTSLKLLCAIQGILPNALKAIRAMDEQLYASCIESLTPNHSERGMITKNNTGSKVLAS